VLLAACGVALAMQGWRTRIPTLDLVPHYLDAIALVRDGVIPSRGTISSFLAYNPPGPTWLLVPGVIATDDPRLVEGFVSAPLYAATLLGIYWLARTSFGRPTALLATGMYAFSDVGLFVAGSLWPRAPIQPFFVWMVYWLQRWAVSRQPGALPIALSLWAAGMFVFMEIAPAILLVPFCWFRYRPPIRAAQLAITAAGVLLMWWPYLAYESQHEYRDLRSMVLRTQVGTPGSARGHQWCDPGITMVNDAGQIVGSSTGTRQAVPESQGALRGAAMAGYKGVLRLRGTVENAVFGVVGGVPPDLRGSHVVVFMAAALSLIAVALSSTALGSFVLSRPLRPSIVRNVLGVALIGLALVVPWAVVSLVSPDGLIEPDTRDALGTLRMAFLAAGAVLVLLLPMSVAVIRFATFATARASNAAPQSFLLFALLVPWAALLILSEPERSDRLWWLWPLTVIFAAALVFHVVGVATVRRRMAAAVLAALIVALTCVTPLNIARLQSWTTGWAGVDADEFRAIDYIASRIAGSRQAKVGYHLRFFRGIPALSAVDRRFKVGAELDLVLLQKHGITNADRCAEGFAPDDDYRLVADALRPSLPGTYPMVGSPDAGFRPVRRFGGIRVFDRLELTGQ
jgi:hypothetical protein